MSWLGISQHEALLEHDVGIEGKIALIRLSDKFHFDGELVAALDLVEEHLTDWRGSRQRPAR